MKDDFGGGYFPVVSLQYRFSSIISLIEPAAVLVIRGSPITIARHFAREIATLIRERSRMNFNPREPYSP